MSASLADFNRYWLEHDDAFTDAVTDDIMAHAGSSYAGAPREQVRENTRRIFQSWHTALEQNTPAPLIESLLSEVGLSSSSPGGLTRVLRDADAPAD